MKDGWLDTDQLGCFKFLEASVNLFWVEAQQKCESIGGYLAEPSTARYTLHIDPNKSVSPLVDIRLNPALPGIHIDPNKSVSPVGGTWLNPALPGTHKENPAKVGVH